MMSSIASSTAGAFETNLSPLATTKTITKNQDTRVAKRNISQCPKRLLISTAVRASLTL